LIQAPEEKVVAVKKETKLSAGRVEGRAAGLQLRARFGARFVPALLLAMPGTALALQCVSKARGWTSHVVRWLVLSLLLTAIAGVRLGPC
jgi:hypothetical protein